MFTKLNQLAKDIAKQLFQDDPRSRERDIFKAANLAIREIGSKEAQDAESFLQNDASSDTWRKAINGNSISRAVNSFQEAFCTNYEELS